MDRDVSTAYYGSSSGDDVDWLCLIRRSTVAAADWCISIIAVVVNDWRILIPIVLTSAVVPGSAGVLFARKNARFFID